MLVWHLYDGNANDFSFLCIKYYLGMYVQGFLIHLNKITNLQSRREYLKQLPYFLPCEYKEGITSLVKSKCITESYLKQLRSKRSTCRWRDLHLRPYIWCFNYTIMLIIRPSFCFCSQLIYFSRGPAWKTSWLNRSDQAWNWLASKIKGLPFNVVILEARNIIKCYWCESKFCCIECKEETRIG